MLLGSRDWPIRYVCIWHNFTLIEIRDTSKFAEWPAAWDDRRHKKYVKWIEYLFWKAPESAHSLRVTVAHSLRFKQSIKWRDAIISFEWVFVPDPTGATIDKTVLRSRYNYLSILWTGARVRANQTLGFYCPTSTSCFALHFGQCKSFLVSPNIV